MGADCYLMRDGEASGAEEDYFRDSYNPTNLAWTLGFSWWKDVVPDLNDSSVLPPKACQEYYDTYKDVEPELPTAKELGCEGDEKEYAEWAEYFKEKRVKFLDLLKRGAAGEGIYMSL